MNLKSIIKQCVTEEISDIQLPINNQPISKGEEDNSSEHSHAPEMRVRSDEPQNDIDESQWPVPEEKRYSDINKWVSDNIKDGKYIGEPLHNYGFTYKVGQPVNMGNGHLLLAMRVWNTAKKSRNNNLKMNRPAGFGTLREGFDPQSMGVNCPMQPGESTNPYKAMNDKMRTMEEDNKKTGILSPKGLATVEKWATTMDSRDAAKRIIDSVLRNKLGLTSDDLADTSTFANGLDTIEDLLRTRDYQGAYDVAKDTANEMIEEEGGGEMDENKTNNPDEDVDYVEYVSQRQGEEPFTLRTGNGQEKFEYCNGKYPSGKVDICVYAFRGDVCYGYNHFRKMFNLSESDITSVHPRDNGANIPREPEDAPNQYTKTNSDMSNMGNLEEDNSGFDKHEMSMGMEVEKEHGNDINMIHKTVKDHLKEDPHYYTKLKNAGLEESLPANFPNKLYRKLKSEYPNNDKTVYATARKLSKKYGDKLNEIAEKSKCKCKNCGKLFEPHYGDYSKCSDCMN